MRGSIPILSITLLFACVVITSAQQTVVTWKRIGLAVRSALRFFPSDPWLRQSGEYGTLGTADPSNRPGNRRQHQLVQHPIDHSFYMFGGNDGSGVYDLADLWRYNTLTNEWTWIGGSQGSVNGVYGTKGVSDPLNGPGARKQYVSWFDASGTYWLLGGLGLPESGSTIDYLNDLWKFDTMSMQWTWMGGNRTANAYGVYPPVSVPSGDGWPGARRPGGTTYDGISTVYLFGGFGYGKSGANGPLNDMWKLDLPTISWTWIGGNSTAGVNSLFNIGRYGVQGTAAPTNWPGARYGAALAFATGQLFLFGGVGYAGTGAAQRMGDMWSYSISTGQWTWLTGYKTNANTEYSVYGLYGVFGSFGVAGTVTGPGARQLHTLRVDVYANLWLIGGQGCDKSLCNVVLNDVWQFNAVSRTWAFMHGNRTGNNAGDFGALNVPSGSNRLPARQSTAAAFDKLTNNLWLHGGDDGSSVFDDVFFLQTDMDECLSNPCTNGGTCTNGVGQFLCSCVAGYSGARCQTDIDECASNPCPAGVPCHDSVANYSCSCFPGFVGQHCETNIDDCASHPCQYGGTCVDGVQSYTCQCKPGTIGTHCTSWCSPTELEFPASSDSIQLANPDFVFANNHYSICLWVRPEVVAGSKLPFLQFGPGTMGYDLLFFGFNDGYLYTELDQWGTGALASSSDYLSSDVGSWHHYCVIYDYSNNDVYLYRDTLQIAFSGSATPFAGVDGPLVLGGFSSTISEVRAYRFYLTASNVTSLFMNQTIAVPNEVLYLKFGEQSGTTTADSSPLANPPLTFNGAPEWTSCKTCSTIGCVHHTGCTDQYDFDGAACVCQAGYWGRTCAQSACDTTPCAHGGSCTAAAGNSYTCACPFAWNGQNCTDVNECASFPCGAGGTCTDGVNGYTCACAAGYFGLSCQTNVNECASQPCVNGATCVDQTNSFSCKCAGGWSGALCQSGIDECASAPCRNGGTCNDGINGFTCQCSGGYSGAVCQTDVNECTSLPCRNGGTCVDHSGSSGGGYHCLCANGYAGSQCQTQLAFCASYPCANGATCIDGTGSYTCICAVGFSGTNCLTNLNECASAPCLNGGTCNDHANAYSCTCPGGWSGLRCQTNIDECASMPCSPLSTCVNQLNKFTCNCAVGYSGSLCQTNINECASQPCANSGTCIDGDGAYACQCRTGYSGLNCQTNVNDCESQPCANAGTCVDGITAYTCTCASGFSGLQCQTNVNECASNPCRAGATCVDGDNQFACTCPPGVSGVLCQTNINECSSQPCANAGTCTDAANGYTCQCSGGFSGLRCQTNVNECASLPCSNGATCVDGTGSYSCTCPNGFIGLRCQTDINECASSPCLNGGTCIDKPNKFMCQCASGYAGLQCENADPCISSPCMNGATCNTAGGFFTCACVNGWSGSRCQTDINECASQPCANGGQCTDARNAYSCACVLGYSGVNCNTAPPPFNPIDTSLVAIRIWMTVPVLYETVGSTAGFLASFLADIRNALTELTASRGGIPNQFVIGAVTAVAGTTSTGESVVWSRVQFDMFALPNGTSTTDAYSVLLQQLNTPNSALRTGAVTSGMTTPIAQPEQAALSLCTDASDQHKYWDVSCSSPDSQSSNWYDWFSEHPTESYSIAAGALVTIVLGVYCVCRHRDSTHRRINSGPAPPPSRGCCACLRGAPARGPPGARSNAFAAAVGGGSGVVAAAAPNPNHTMHVNRSVPAVENAPTDSEPLNPVASVADRYADSSRVTARSVELTQVQARVAPSTPSKQARQPLLVENSSPDVTPTVSPQATPVRGSSTTSTAKSTPQSLNAPPGGARGIPKSSRNLFGAVASTLAAADSSEPADVAISIGASPPLAVGTGTNRSNSSQRFIDQKHDPNDAAAVASAAAADTPLDPPVMSGNKLINSVQKGMPFMVVHPTTGAAAKLVQLCYRTDETRAGSLYWRSGTKADVATSKFTRRNRLPLQHILQMWRGVDSHTRVPNCPHPTPFSAKGTNDVCWSAQTDAVAGGCVHFQAILPEVAADWMAGLAAVRASNGSAHVDAWLQAGNTQSVAPASVAANAAPAISPASAALAAVAVSKSVDADSDAAAAALTPSVAGFDFAAKPAPEVSLTAAAAALVVPEPLPASAVEPPLVIPPPPASFAGRSITASYVDGVKSELRANVEMLSQLADDEHDEHSHAENGSEIAASAAAAAAAAANPIVVAPPPPPVQPVPEPTPSAAAATVPAAASNAIVSVGPTGTVVVTRTTTTTTTETVETIPFPATVPPPPPNGPANGPT